MTTEKQTEKRPQLIDKFTLEVSIPVEVHQGPGNVVYATSPLVPSLLLLTTTEERQMASKVLDQLQALLLAIRRRDDA